LFTVLLPESEVDMLNHGGCLLGVVASAFEDIRLGKTVAKVIKQLEGKTDNLPAQFCGVLVAFWEDMSSILVSPAFCVRAVGATVVFMEPYCSLFISCVGADDAPPWT
jgi:hypothetical protein